MPDDKETVGGELELRSCGEAIELQQKVDAALDTAVNENGYTKLVTWDAIAVAMDLVDCNETFDNYRPSALVSYIRSWQSRNGGELVEIKWEKDAHRGQSVFVPKVALALAETELVVQLTEYGSRENKRANANALETMALGRQLSITNKALRATHDLLAVAQRLQRAGLASTSALDALQNSSDLDKAVRAAVKALEQLDKEYPEER